MPPVALPRPISVEQFTPAVEPSFTDIYNATMGDAFASLDAIQPQLDAMGALLDLFGAEMDAETALDNFGQAVSLFGAVDLSSLDAHVGNYDAAVPVGDGILATMQTHKPPLLLELPMSFTFNGGIGTAPTQSTIDLGTFKLGAAPFDHFLGQTNNQADGTVTGLATAIIALKTGGNWDIVVKEVTRVTGQVLDSYYVEFTPDTVGQFTAQINLTVSFPASTSIVTLTATVVP